MAAQIEFLVQKPDGCAKVAKDKLEQDEGGSTGPDLELPQGARRAALKKIKYRQSTQSKDDRLEETYIPNAESEGKTHYPTTTLTAMTMIKSLTPNSTASRRLVYLRTASKT
jgi:hypothetical protein